jgi:hypothetical protein
MEYMSGRGLAEDCLKAISRQTKSYGLELDEFTVRTIISNAILYQFQLSDPLNDDDPTKGKPFGLLAEQVTTSLRWTDDVDLTI